MTRQCSKTGCTGPAVATLTYVYRDRAAALGPLATYAEPHTYDLCARHAERLTAPKGWQVIRVRGEYAPPLPSADDLLALADAVREPAGPRPAGAAQLDVLPDHRRHEAATGAVEVARRGHLRVLRDP